MYTTYLDIRFRYILVFQKFHQYNHRHRVPEEDYHMLDFGFFLRLHMLQDKLPNRSSRPNHH